MKVQTEGPEIWIIVIFTAFVPIDFTADLPCYTEISNRPTIKKTTEWINKEFAILFSMGLQWKKGNFLWIERKIFN